MVVFAIFLPGISVTRWCQVLVTVVSVTGTVSTHKVVFLVETVMTDSSGGVELRLVSKSRYRV